MFDFLRKKYRSAGSVLFPGSLPLPLDNFGHLRDEEIEIDQRSPSEEHLWEAIIQHPEWGQARVACPRHSPPPPRDIVEFDPRLMEHEVDAISRSESSIFVTMLHPRQNVLRERKNALRLMHALMGKHGVSVVDHGSQRFWSPPSLEEELAHDADLDIDSLFILHAVHPEDAREDEEPRVSWLHSHGLGELGYFDYDILAPSPDVFAGLNDLTRAVAFGIVEGWIEPDGGPIVIAEPDGEFRMVPVDRFERRAADRFIRLRDDPDGTHAENRSVICEPRRGIFSSLFGEKVEPSRWLRGPIDDNSILHYSPDATALMADRARGTYGLCRRYTEEFRDLEVKALFKLGLPVDGSDPKDNTREHLWFEATELRSDRLSGVLLNQPWYIANLQEGREYSYDLEVLSDWNVFTPAGRITPTELVAARMLRENRDAILEMLRQSDDPSLT